MRTKEEIKKEMASLDKQIERWAKLSKGRELYRGLLERRATLRWVLNED